MTALVGDVHGRQAQASHEHFAGQMRWRTQSGRPEIELSRVGAQIGQKFADRSGGVLGRYRKEQGHIDQYGDRNEIGRAHV